MSMSEQMQDMGFPPNQASAAISEIDALITDDKMTAGDLEREMESHQKVIDKLTSCKASVDHRVRCLEQARAALVTVSGIDQNKANEEKINDDLPDESAKPDAPAQSFLEAFDDLFGGALRDLFPGAYKSTDDDEPDWGNVNG